VNINNDEALSNVTTSKQNEILTQDMNVANGDNFIHKQDDDQTPCQAEAQEDEGDQEVSSDKTKEEQYSETNADMIQPAFQQEYIANGEDTNINSVAASSENNRTTEEKIDDNKGVSHLQLADMNERITNTTSISFNISLSSSTDGDDLNDFKQQTTPRNNTNAFQVVKDSVLSSTSDSFGEEKKCTNEENIIEKNVETIIETNNNPVEKCKVMGHAASSYSQAQEEPIATTENEEQQHQTNHEKDDSDIEETRTTNDENDNRHSNLTTNDDQELRFRHHFIKNENKESLFNASDDIGTKSNSKHQHKSSNDNQDVIAINDETKDIQAGVDNILGTSSEALLPSSLSPLNKEVEDGLKTTTLDEGVVLSSNDQLSKQDYMKIISQTKSLLNKSQEEYKERNNEMNQLLQEFSTASNAITPTNAKDAVSNTTTHTTAAIAENLISYKKNFDTIKEQLQNTSDTPNATAFNERLLIKDNANYFNKSDNSHKQEQLNKKKPKKPTDIQKVRSFCPEDDDDKCDIEVIQKNIHSNNRARTTATPSSILASRRVATTPSSAITLRGKAAIKNARNINVTTASNHAGTPTNSRLVRSPLNKIRATTPLNNIRSTPLNNIRSTPLNNIRYSGTPKNNIRSNGTPSSYGSNRPFSSGTPQTKNTRTNSSQTQPRNDSNIRNERPDSISRPTAFTFSGLTTPKGSSNKSTDTNNCQNLSLEAPPGPRDIISNTRKATIKPPLNTNKANVTAVNQPQSIEHSIPTSFSYSSGEEDVSMISKDASILSYKSHRSESTIALRRLASQTTERLSAENNKSRYTSGVGMKDREQRHAKMISLIEKLSKGKLSSK